MPSQAEVSAAVSGKADEAEGGVEWQDGAKPMQLRWMVASHRSLHVKACLASIVCPIFNLHYLGLSTTSLEYWSTPDDHILLDLSG